MARLLVLDFDGTMTDAEAEGAPFTEGYLEDIALLTDRSLPEIKAMAAGFQAEVNANPEAHGWIFNGRLVAPASVDPYLRIMPVTKMIFEALGEFGSEGDRTRLLEKILYKYNYAKTLNVPRPHARELLESLRGTRSYIVSNSNGHHVQNKLRAIGRNADGTNSLEWLIDHVHGDAQKYFVDDAFDAVPESFTIEGLGRPVLLRRRRYHERLSELLAREGSSWEELTVVGDIFELDLSLPLAMGARVGLAVNPFTPAYEQRFVENHPRGRLIHDLADVRAFAGV
jgi:phosphoglycolate phosphatase-like HAD superfamily hydrolase